MADASTLPAAITLDATTGQETVKVFETEYLKTGIFIVEVTVTDPKTSVSTSVQLQVNIKCTKSIKMLVNPLTTHIYNVGTDTLEPTDLALPTYSP